MSYGLELNNGTYDNANPLALGGNVFVQLIQIPDQANGTVSTYDFNYIPSHTYLRVYYVQSGSHSVSLSTVGGKARLTATAVKQYVGGATTLLVFTTYTTEPEYGLTYTNTSGDRIVSTNYPLPKFEGKISFSTTPSYYTSVTDGTHDVYVHQAASSLGGLTNRLILWTIPDQAADVWYYGTGFVPSSQGGFTASINILVPKTGATYTLPEALVFSLSGFQASSDSYGLRLYNESGTMIFDAGLKHMQIKAYGGVQYGTTQYSETNTQFGSTVPAVLLPQYYELENVAISGLSSSNYYERNGAVKRSGNTLYSKKFLTNRGVDDISLTSLDTWGSSANTTLIANAELFGGGYGGSNTVGTVSPTYSVSGSPTTVNEGTAVTFTVNTTNVASGTTLYWTSSSASDTSPSSGSFTINNNTGTFSTTVLVDSLTEGTETFTASVRTGSISGSVVATSNSITINDTSQTPAPTYSVSPNASSVNEGSSVTFNVNTTNVSNGTTLYWTSSNTTDVTPTSGSFTVNSNAGSFSVTAIADSVTEGAESFTVSIRTVSTSGTVVATSSSVTINDTSQTPVPTYSVSPGASNVNEGSSVTFNVSTTNVAGGTTLYWTSSTSDVTPTSGSFTISGGAGSFSVTAIADSTTEGSETFTVSVRTDSTSGTVVATSSSVTINDTSQTPAPTYSVSPSSSSVNEGSNLTFNVSTTGVANGTTLYWTNSLPSDISPSSGSFTINSGVGSFVVSAGADTTTEGPETFTVSVRTDSTSGTIVATSSSVTINDTSTTPAVSYSITPSVTSVDEGGGVTFYVNTTSVPNGTTLYWTVSRPEDITPISGSFTVRSGVGTFNVTIDADATTEGTETFTASVRTGSTSGTIRATSVSITINDTSTTLPPPGYTLASGFAETSSATDLVGGYAGVDLYVGSDGFYTASSHTGATLASGWWVSPLSAVYYYNFYVRFTQVFSSGLAYGGASGSTGWLSLGSTRSVSVYSLTSTSTQRTVSATYLVEFSSNGYSSEASGYYTLNATSAFSGA